MTILACFKSLSRDTSLMAVHGAPSSCSNLISFKATNFPVMLFSCKRNRDLNTRYIDNKVLIPMIACSDYVSITANGTSVLSVYSKYYIGPEELSVFAAASTQILKLN